MGWILRCFGWLGAWIVLLAIGFFMWALVVEYNPEPTENIVVVGESERLNGDTIKIVSWNIGYAGLGSDMDFFYDGGQSVQCSRGRTLQNLDSIVSFLSRHTDADFILLQEVDFDSKRSYGINEYDTIIKHLGLQYKGYYALNFSALFVPIPISNPIGDVQGGLVTLSAYRPKSALRYQYPGGFSWPTRMFNLKRGMLSIEVEIADSTSLFIGNTHNSAYDDGQMRAGEMMFIDQYLQPKKYGIVAGDWNANPPGYSPSTAETGDEYFSPAQVAAATFATKGHWGWDKSAPTAYTARYGYEPYRAASTTRTVIDFSFSTERLVPLSVECVDLKFENSDHNPIIYTFKITR